MPFSLSLMSYELTIVRNDELCQQEIEKKMISDHHALILFLHVYLFFLSVVVSPGTSSFLTVLPIKNRYSYDYEYNYNGFDGACIKKKKETCETILYLH